MTYPISRWLVLLSWAVLGGLSLAWAQPQARQARPMAEDPVIEARLVDIASELRCLVCQNESLASSHAELAQDLRDEVRGLIRQGKSDAEVKDYLVQRYGDFVLYRPAFKPMTYVLWGGPFVLLCVALWALWRVLRARRQQITHKPLDAQDHQRAAQLLKDSS
jgi:cytochrome c-type biogenesis protein CcmH